MCIARSELKGKKGNGENRNESEKRFLKLYALKRRTGEGSEEEEKDEKDDK